MLKDIRYAIRVLAKSPAFAAVAVLSLALGIGANTAILSLLNALLLRPIPVQDPSGLVSIFTTDQRNPGNLPLSHLNYKDLRDQHQVFSGMSAFTFAQLNWSHNSKYNGVAEDPIPFIYQPIRQNYTPTATLHVRAAGEASGLTSAVRATMREVDPTLSVFDVRTLEEQVSTSLAPLRINVVVLMSFGALALLLASIGLYGVASYSVSQRTREIGVRMALGAQRSSVLSLLPGRGLMVVGIGIAVGLVSAIALASLVPPTLLPHASTRDPLTLAGTSIVLALVALVAVYIPALRATRIDPLVALRTE